MSSFFCDKEDLSNGYHIISTPHENTTQKGYFKGLLKNLTPIEAIVYCTYELIPVRKLSTFLKIHYTHIKSIYIRACDKIRKAEKG